MSSYGLSDAGFLLKRFEDILSDLNADVRAILGTDLNLDSRSPDGQINEALARSESDLWEIIQQVSDAYNPSAATGKQMSDLVLLNGITRDEATSSQVTLDLTTNQAATIPALSEVSSDAGYKFIIQQDTIFTGAGTQQALALAEETGPVAAAAGSITTIDTPITGWTTVDNPADATPGVTLETDAELRARRSLAVASPSQGGVDSLFAGITAVPEVISVTVLENDTDVADGNGQDPHSVQAIVVGGADQDIRDAIFIRKAPGVNTVGNVSGTSLDIQGIEHDILFTRPTVIPIFIEIDLVTGPDYPATGDQLIKDALIAYGDANFGADDDVIYTRLFTPINSVAGHEVTALKIGLAASPTGVTNIPIAFNQISSFLDANITVNS